MTLAFCTSRCRGVELAHIFQDNMVLQRDLAVPVWGQAAPGETVTVRFAGQNVTTRADADGRWRLKLAPLTASSVPQDFVVEAQASKILRNVLVGEVWLASGQSNMGLCLKDTLNGKAVAAAADCPLVREFQVPNDWRKQPIDDLKAGVWLSCTPKTAGYFSGAAYYFARELQARLGVPVGIINSSWGGSACEAWTPLDKMRAHPELYKGQLAQYDGLSSLTKEEIVAQRAEAEKAQRHKDPGNAGEGQGWARPEADLTEWRDIEVPGYLEQVYGEVDGAFWFRREIQIPAGWAGQTLTLKLGAVDDLDTTYFNGVAIGATGFEVPEWWAFQRVYPVPAQLVKAGANTLAVRVFDERYAGGLVGPQIELCKSGAVPIELQGIWKIREERRMAPLPMPAMFFMQHIPSYLFNAMISPLAPYAIRGAIWYQGENNTGRAKAYQTLFSDLIQGWRQAWGQGDFPFYFVQLPNYMKRQAQPTESNWARLREAQELTLSLPRTGMAVTIDIGDAVDIHPPNKSDVGKRLALLAFAEVYGVKDVVAFGPRFASMKIEGDTVRIKFNHAEGLHAVDDDVKGLALCGEDGVFVWADTVRIEGQEVVASAKTVAHPVAVRYAWADNPECNLYNAAGLPAAPFRTDDYGLR